MSEEHLINSVNKHYLDRVMMLAEEKDIKATEDIFDARGVKLVAKGSRISCTQMCDSRQTPEMGCGGRRVRYRKIGRESQTQGTSCRGSVRGRMQRREGRLIPAA
jgi:hypothetical protein